MSHKIPLVGGSKFEEPIHKFLGSIRSKVLQKLVLLWFLVVSGYASPLYQELETRVVAKGLPACASNRLYSLTPGDVMPLIGCSRRTAIEYIQALRTLCA